ncbi:hypothetical protein RWV98_01795 [Agathobaculum sp. NTUH-O15-33]|uniref:hypothetical protein n=1 Tax=Agathobaculum sp. NTUH-O15-33 TaxID=3079302 RepID=UPI0029585728|nr:hypothetical protein [Agathobaculum sp. NTUH-O15-33]WNX85032.1 hypothetical protein RWV98_01795 [Agathobaculum sp. NTUH-O15-33]
MKEAICKTCKYFYQHYIRLTKDRYTITPSGHCVYPRIKLRHEDAPACPHYQEAEPHK